LAAGKQSQKRRHDFEFSLLLEQPSAREDAQLSSNDHECADSTPSAKESERDNKNETANEKTQQGSEPAACDQNKEAG